MVECRSNGRKSADGTTTMRKGPWLPEEDEILLQYVRQFGARDWSSIRSKGLLPRTGKSCRLRWVNKLRPDLKSGCKFSPEEERIVIDLQAKFGNKWARIATYLPGRTDNDVKNFWSTRQKRLARILHGSSSTQAQAPPPVASRPIHPPPNLVAADAGGVDQFAKTQIFHEFSVFEAPPLNPLPISVESQSGQASRSMTADGITMVPLMDLINADLLNSEGNSLLPQESMYVNQKNEEDTASSKIQLPPPDFQFETIKDGVNAATGYCNNSIPVYNFDDESLKLPLDLPIFNYACQGQIKQEAFDYPATPDTFFDDFPADMFNYSEPIQMPTTVLPDWSSLV